MTVHTRIKSDHRPFYRSLDRYERMPDNRMIAKLDSLLNAEFIAAQADVHMQTGSLKSSGKKTSSVNRETHTWEGTLRWGGPSTGTNNPVDYAIYEQRREPDERGDHDFLRSLETFILPTIETLLKGA